MVSPLIFLAFFTPLLNLLINPFVYFDFLSSDSKAAKIDQCSLHAGSMAIPSSPYKRIDQGRNGHNIWFLFYRQIGQKWQTFLSVFPQISCITDLPSDVGEYK